MDSLETLSRPCFWPCRTAVETFDSFGTLALDGFPKNPKNPRGAKSPRSLALEG